MYKGGHSTVLLFETVGRFGFDSYKFTDVGRGGSVNSLESEKQDLELNSLYDRQPVKLSQCRSHMAEFTKDKSNSSSSVL